MLCSQSYFLDSYQHVAGWNLRESIRKKVVPILKYVYKLKLSSGVVNFPNASRVAVGYALGRVYTGCRMDFCTVAAPTNSDSVTNKKCWLCNMVLKLKFIKCHPTERKSVAYKIRNLKN
jgi:hypothetical protein